MVYSHIQALEAVAFWGVAWHLVATSALLVPILRLVFPSPWYGKLLSLFIFFESRHHLQYCVQLFISLLLTCGNAQLEVLQRPPGTLGYDKLAYARALVVSSSAMERQFAASPPPVHFAAGMDITTQSAKAKKPAALLGTKVMMLSRLHELQTVCALCSCLSQVLLKGSQSFLKIRPNKVCSNLYVIFSLARNYCFLCTGCQLCPD
jgi:hypothetical protein